MRLLTFIHALITWAAVNILSGVLARVPDTGLRDALALVSAGVFIPFSLSVSAGLHNQRMLIVVVLVLTLLIAWPFHTDNAARLIIPIPAGLLVGTALRYLLVHKPEDHHA
jgi:hypothetical protein